jgi:hypothetical protein
MGNREWETANEEQRMGNGEWETANEEQRMGNPRWGLKVGTVGSSEVVASAGFVIRLKLLVC